MVMRFESWGTPGWRDDFTGNVVSGIVDLAEQGEHWRDEFARPCGIDCILAFERDRSRIRYISWEEPF